MSSGLSESGQASAIVLVGLLVLAIPAGLAVAQGLSTPTAEQSTIPTITPPPLTSPTPTETPTETATPTLTSTPTPTPDGDDNNTDGDGTNEETYFVNAGVGPADGVTSDDGCSGANYKTIQAAVDAAEPGDTVAVCPGTYSEHVEVTTADLTITAMDRNSPAVDDVTITNANESAVWINAPGVTLQGFNISVDEGTDFAIEVGGQEVVIRDNTVDSPGVGIFLSDGQTETGECQLDEGFYRIVCDPSPSVDPALGAATQGRVVNNTVSAEVFRIWADADQAVIQNNFVTDRTQHNQAPENDSGYDPNCVRCERFNTSILSSGNETVIRANTVQQNDGGEFSYPEAGIQVGKTPREGHNTATNNLVIANSVTKPSGAGIKTRIGTNGTIIRGNSVTQTAGGGIRVSDSAVIRNNTVGDIGQTVGRGIETFGEQGDYNYSVGYYNPTRFQWQVRIINNTVSGQCWGIQAKGGADVTIKGNTAHKNYCGPGINIKSCGLPSRSVRVVNNEITDNRDELGGGSGIAIGGTKSCPEGLVKSEMVILNNLITNNEAYGIFIHEHAPINRMEIHGNLINNNPELGIYNDNRSMIVDGTNNIWECGGPSSGSDPLADPYTGRLANGSGDAISGGNGSTRNGHPISNVHFDPFQVLSSCPDQKPTPSPTATPTATPTPPPDGGGSGDGDGGDGAGSGDGSSDGNGAGSGDSTESGEGDSGDSDAPSNDGGNTGTPPPKSTATPTATPPPTPTTTPPDTPTPTPVVEPGFGVATWLVGFLLAVSLLARRIRGDQ